MSRGFSSSINTALTQSSVRLVTFAELDFSSGKIYVHDGLGTYTWGGNNWLGVGDFGGISSVQEGTEVSPYSLQLTLSGLDASIVSTALDKNDRYFMRDIKVYLGLLNADDELIDTPSQIWAGFMDVMTLTAGESGGDAITLTAESELARFDRSPNLRYTHTMLQKRNSDDKFFEFLKDIEGVKISWGKQTSGNLAGSTTDNLNDFGRFANMR